MHQKWFTHVTVLMCKVLYLLPENISSIKKALASKNDTEKNQMSMLIYSNTLLPCLTSVFAPLLFYFLLT